MSIDWSKAPEGANKAGFTGHDNYLQFYRIPGRFGDYDYWSEKRGWCGNNFPTCADHLFERPAKVEWDGQGLPPVGISVEWLSSAHGWLGGRVVGHDGSVAVVSHNDGYTGCHPHEVRPMPTPEQIAAEERAKAIEEMCFAVETLTVKQAKALFDAGYRRQEEGK
ncbi:hypothetical protein N0691_31095 [Pseudomonas aeruginosa]|nr:hypothetical protein [Pseudomonas aeruginosa]HEK2232695.1 hypothetical protein [Pseudomonas aeruginosa]